MVPVVILHPANIQVIGRELAVAWSDGSETYVPLEKLRRACPCAVCGGEPDVLGNIVRPLVSYNDKSFLLHSYHGVGGYALQCKWGDGHDTGLYTYPYLKTLA